MLYRGKVIRAVMVNELRLQMRSSVLWLFLGIVCAFSTVFTTVFNTQEWASSMARDMLSANLVRDTVLYSGLVGFLGLPFVFMGIFGRDKRYKVHSLLWSRALLAVDYALGKAFAVTVISMLFGTLPLVCGWVVGSIRFAGLLPVVPWIQYMLALWPGYILMGLFTLVCLRLAPIPLVGTLIGAGVSFLLLVGWTQNMKVPTNIALLSVYYSPAIQFGLDLWLVIAQSLCFLSFGFVCIGVLCCVFPWSERYVLKGRWHRVSSVIVVIVAIVLALTSVGNFQSLAEDYDDATSYPEKPMVAHVSQYHLAVEANTSTGKVKGRASFVLTPQKNGVQAVYIMLARSLKIEAAKVKAVGTSSEKVVGTQSRDGWSRIDLVGSGFAEGKPVQVSMEYSGLLIANRYNYVQLTTGFLNPQSYAAVNSDRASYVSQDMAFLHGMAGTWYPLPWVEQMMSVYSARPVIDDLTLRLPLQLEVFSSLGSEWRKIDEQWQELHVQSGKSLPMVVLAAFKQAQKMNLSGSTVFHQGIQL